MMTLYDYLPSQNAWKIRQLLNHLEQPYEQVFISIFEAQGKTEDYLAINPTGAVPALRTCSGATIAESNAILVYLAQETEYLPTDTTEQAQVMQWLFFEADYVQASVATLRHWILTAKDQNRSADMLESKRSASLKVLSILDHRLKSNTYLCGQNYSIADISVFAYVHLAQEAHLPLENYQYVQRWIDAVKSQPGYLAQVYPYSIDPHSANEL
ncbi:MAG: glutathione S-transferase family protein [Granulosicoccus sp.]